MATATFSTPSEVGANIIIPVSISASNVTALSESCIKFEASSGSIDGAENISWIVQYVSDGNFKIILSVAAGAQVTGTLSIDGYIYSGATAEAVTTTATMTLRLDGRVPTLEHDFDVPTSYAGDTPFDVLFGFQRDAKFIDPATIHQDATWLDHFIFAGVDLGLPTLYQKVDSVYPTRPIGRVSDTDNTPVGGYAPVSNASIPGRPYLLRYPPVTDKQGFFDVLLREGAVQGDILKLNGFPLQSGKNFESLQVVGDRVYALDDADNYIYAYGFTGIVDTTKSIRLSSGQWDACFIEGTDFYVYNSYYGRISQFSAAGVENTAARVTLQRDLVSIYKIPTGWAGLNQTSNQIRFFSETGTEDVTARIALPSETWAKFWKIGDVWAIAGGFNPIDIRFFSDAGVEDTAKKISLPDIGFKFNRGLYRGGDYWAYVIYDILNSRHSVEVRVDAVS